ncbi:hypothetical protein AcV7_003037 [Taiwanofungus camphoratus]|nr:hypothetical protein AcW2_005303 [Antrodia cinnamomea]KAI0940734.1 hypothetical protein AcV7_003037 [Antrodia cinnamomea]
MNALQVWAVAYHCGLKNEAWWTSISTLLLPIEGEYCKELEEVTVGAYFWLLRYYMDLMKHRLRLYSLQQLEVEGPWGRAFNDGGHDAIPYSSFPRQCKYRSGSDDLQSV